jgi:hypothetical protein
MLFHLVLDEGGVSYLHVFDNTNISYMRFRV